jgi:hypothetical protein
MTLVATGATLATAAAVSAGATSAAAITAAGIAGGALAGAAGGAALGAGTAALTGGDVGKGALMGAAAGGVGGGLGIAAGGAGAAAGAAGEAGAAGGAGGAAAGEAGAAAGGAGAAAGDAASAASTATPGIFGSAVSEAANAHPILTGALTGAAGGATGAAAGGEDPGTGALGGAVVGGLGGYMKGPSGADTGASVGDASTSGGIVNTEAGFPQATQSGISQPAMAKAVTPASLSPTVSSTPPADTGISSYLTPKNALVAGIAGASLLGPGGSSMPDDSKRPAAPMLSPDFKPLEARAIKPTMTKYAGGGLASSFGDSYLGRAIGNAGGTQPTQATQGTQPGVQAPPPGPMNKYYEAGVQQAKQTLAQQQQQNQQPVQPQQPMQSPIKQQTPLLPSGATKSAAKGGLMQYDLGHYAHGGVPGLIRGPGDGVSDGIPATINNKQPARIADGEFIIPARIVSELGNGSTEAGAKQLNAMIDRVQARRSKSAKKGKVATKTKASSVLPA